jgi:predicted component of type VI protein secretion system
MAKLVVLSEGLTGRTCELKEDKTTIGRLEENSFQIAEPSVSSRHCEIFRRGTDYVVKDLNSTNGTFINGEQVSETVLKPGQILRLGQIEMRLETGATPPGKPHLDQTRVMPQGVKFDLEQGKRPDSPFAKKTNKPAMIFITIGAILGAIIIGLVIYAIQKMQ